MDKNVGKNDKIIRYILGIVFIYLGYSVSPWFYLFAAISIITAVMGVCGIYKLFNINTNK